MKSKKANHLRTVIAHVVLVILSFMCLFFFYILIVNSTEGVFGTSWQPLYKEFYECCK